MFGNFTSVVLAKIQRVGNRRQTFRSVIVIYHAGDLDPLTVNENPTQRVPPVSQSDQARIVRMAPARSLFRRPVTRRKGPMLMTSSFLPVTWIRGVSLHPQRT